MQLELLDVGQGFGVGESETGLARMWAKHVWGETWDKVSPTRRRIEIAAALDEIHFACARPEPVDAG